MLFFKKKDKTNNRINRTLKNPKILEVNLIKDEIRLGFNIKKNLKNLLIVLVVVSLFVVELYFGLDWWQKDEEMRLEQLNIDIKKSSQEISDFRKDAADALSYRDKTIEVNNLLNNHVYWTNFFSWLEKNTLSTISFNGFSGELDGKYTLSGNAGSFAEVSWQVKQLIDDPIVLKVEVNNAQSGDNKTKAQRAADAIAKSKEIEEALANGEEIDASLEEEEGIPGVGFELILEINPEIFKK